MRLSFDVEVNPIRRTSIDGIGLWSCASGKRPSQLSESTSPRAPGPWQEQFAAELIEVGQRKHGLRSRQVLGQAAIAHFGEAPQLLDHSKGVLAAGTCPRARSIDQAPAFTQRATIGATINPVVHAFGRERLAVGFLPVGLISKHRPLPAVEQMRKLSDI